MKIVLCDYEDTLNSRNTDYEVELLKRLLPNADIVIQPYQSDEALVEILQGAQGLITAFVKIGEDILCQCKELRCISVNATGYDAIDVTAASERNIGVCVVREYCTQEVADHTMAMLLALARRLKAHQYWIDEKKRWQYNLVGPISRIQDKILAIFGLGRIGQAVAKRAKSFGFKVVAVDPYLPQSVADDLEIPLVDEDYVCKYAHFITNHMNATSQNTALFDAKFFEGLLQAPIFVNVSRADAVDEAALLKALEQGIISGAGLDVISSIGLNLEEEPLIGRNDMIITPHAAFYTAESLRDLQDISCRNMALYLSGELDQVARLVNKKSFMRR